MGNKTMEAALMFAQLLISAQNMKFSIKDFFSKCSQICRKLRIWSHLLKKSFVENFIFCAVNPVGLASQSGPFI